MTLADRAKDLARVIMLDHNSPRFRFEFLTMQDEPMRREIIKHLEPKFEELQTRFQEMP